MRAIVPVWLALGCALLLANRGFADAPSDAIELSPNQRLELTLDPNDAVQSKSIGEANASDLAALPSISNATERLVAAGVKSGPPKPGVIVFSLWSDPKDGAKLMIANGYSRPIIYQATLILEQYGKRFTQPTSICPVRPGTFSVETWANHVVGVAISGFRDVDPNNLACNGGSLLTAAPLHAATDRYACVGGEQTSMNVTLIVDADGAVQAEEATWFLAGKDPTHGPAVLFDFGMLGRQVVQTPSNVRVVAVVGMTPPPKAQTAQIVLLLNGTEKARRPWQMYARAMAAPPDPAKPRAGFFGVIPFVDSAGPSDSGLRELLAAVGRPGMAIEAQVVGDDGHVISDGTHAVDSPPLRSASAVGADLDDALAKAKTPAQCHKVSP